MQNDNPEENFPSKCGDRVRSKLNPNEYGGDCCISYTARAIRVLQQYPLGKIWWYDVSELELI